MNKRIPSLDEYIMESDVAQESVELNEANITEWFTIKQDASRITFALQSGSKKHVVNALTKCKKVTVSKQWTYIETAFGNVYIERNKENDFLTIQQFFESGTMGDKIIINIEDLQNLINTIKSADIKKSHTYEIKK
ncbi:MAG TPA: hypothetical protein P5509_09970 [Bacteroidales bacterium]|nr:hypothetical protein [Bacteroidales bacterium]